MQSKRKRAGGGTAVLAVLTALVVLGTAITGATASSSSTATRGLARQWTEQSLKGNVRLDGLVPLAVTRPAREAARSAPGEGAADAQLLLPAARPGRSRPPDRAAGEDPPLPQPQAALRALLAAAGAGDRGRPLAPVEGLPHHPRRRDRLSIAARASTATVERALKVRIADFVHPGTTLPRLKVEPYRFFANTSAPTLPARLGIQTRLGPERRLAASSRPTSSRTRRRRTGAGLEDPVRPRAAATSRPTCAASTTSPATASTAPARRSA